MSYEHSSATHKGKEGLPSCRGIGVDACKALDSVILCVDALSVSFDKTAAPILAWHSAGELKSGLVDVLGSEKGPSSSETIDLVKDCAFLDDSQHSVASDTPGSVLAGLAIVRV